MIITHTHTLTYLTFNTTIYNLRGDDEEEGTDGFIIFF